MTSALDVVMAPCSYQPGQCTRPFGSQNPALIVVNSLFIEGTSIVQSENISPYLARLWLIQKTSDKRDLEDILVLKLSMYTN